MVQGREFGDSDRLGSSGVAVVNQALARRLWPGGGALGKTLQLAGGTRRVVGIVQDLILNGREEQPQPQVYIPFWQNPGQIDARCCVRVRGDAASMLPNLVREVNRIDPDLPIAETLSLKQALSGMFRPLRLAATFVTYADSIAVLLSALGLYGSLAFAVSRRRREIGIRMGLSEADPAESPHGSEAGHDGRAERRCCGRCTGMGGHRPGAPPARRIRAIPCRLLSVGGGRRHRRRLSRLLDAGPTGCRRRSSAGPARGMIAPVGFCLAPNQRRSITRKP